MKVEIFKLIELETKIFVRSNKKSFVQNALFKSPKLTE